MHPCLLFLIHRKLAIRRGHFLIRCSKLFLGVLLRLGVSPTRKNSGMSSDLTGSPSRRLALRDCHFTNLSRIGSARTLLPPPRMFLLISLLELTQKLY